MFSFDFFFCVENWHYNVEMCLLDCWNNCWGCVWSIQEGGCRDLNGIHYHFRISHKYNNLKSCLNININPCLLQPPICKAFCNTNTIVKFEFFQCNFSYIIQFSQCHLLWIALKLCLNYFEIVWCSIKSIKTERTSIDAEFVQVWPKIYGRSEANNSSRLSTLHTFFVMRSNDLISVP